VRKLVVPELLPIPALVLVLVLVLVLEQVVLKMQRRKVQVANSTLPVKQGQYKVRHQSGKMRREKLNPRRGIV